VAALSEAAATGPLDWTLSTGPLDLVLDIGKTRTRLFVLDGQGAVQAQAEQPSASVPGGTYLALDVPGIAAWLETAIVALGPLRAQLRRAVVSAHGAAFAALDGDRLAWPVPDYEFQGFDERSAGWAQAIAPFDETQSPDLPRGLNAATQFDWLERRGHAVGTKQLLPYPQYWAWWLSGVAASEASSLGCHTHLWNPAAGDFSTLAQARGWAAAMAPLRRAWDLLGPVRPDLAARLGLPPALQVCVGVHDSNACLARYLRSHPRLTLVTTGTWVVVMAPGAPRRALDARLDLLANVSVRQEAVPTGRFMGGRELQHLCAGADPALANLQDLQRLLDRGVMALPGFEPQGGPFREHTGQVLDPQGPLALRDLTAAERATLAALYAAQVTAWLVHQLGGLGPVVVEGPFAPNGVYAQVLAQLCGASPVLTSTDTLEGTARGAWMLTHWTEPGISPAATARVQPAEMPGLQALHQRWLAGLAAA
jgi:sugar (pentulose or hexulose) kinase